MPKVRWQDQEVDAVEVRYKSVREDWNEYDIDDGTTVRVKLLVSEIVRLTDRFDQEGNPVYVIKSGNVVFVKAPDHLKRKA